MSSVREIRKSLGMSVKEFAHLFNVSTRTIVHWESGKHPPGGSSKVILDMIINSPKFVWQLMANRGFYWPIEDRKRVS